MARNRRKLFAQDRWVVESFHRGEWQAIYTAPSEAQAMVDAVNWREATGHRTRIRPGESYRGRDRSIIKELP